jgi:hypothetical protein
VYDLRPFATKLISREAQLSRAELLALHPVEILADGGLYNEEHDTNLLWRWSTRKSGLMLRNELNFPRSIEVRTSLETQGRLIIAYSKTSDTIAIGSPIAYKRVVRLPAQGYVRLSFSCNCSRVNAPSDPRSLYLKVANFVAVDPFALDIKGNASGKQVPVANAGFENGRISPWMSFQSVQGTASSEHVHSGRFSLQESSGGGSFYQDISGLEPGTTYTISAWVASSPGGNSTAEIAVWDPTTNLATFSQTLLPKSTWQVLEQHFRVGLGGTVRIHLFRNTGAGSIFWDDIQVSSDDSLPTAPK